MKKFVACGLPLIALGLAGCGSSGGITLTGHIAIGTVFSLTGAAAAYGPSQRFGTRLAASEINASGMLDGATLNLIEEDDASTGTTAATIFGTLINSNHVTAILGPTLSSTALVADPVGQAAGTPVLGVSNTATGIVEIGNFIFRDSLPESTIAPQVITKTHTSLGYQTAAMMYGNDDAFTIDSYTAFRTALEADGVTIADVQTFQQGDTDFTSQLQAIAALQPAPGALVISAFGAEAAPILVQARAAGLTQPIIGGNGFNSATVVTQAGAAAEGLLTGTAWHQEADTPGNAAFVGAYQAQVGNPPDQFAAQAYAGLYLLARAIANANSTDRAKVRDSLAALRDVPTVLGSFSFDTNRNPQHDALVQRVENGQFVVVP